MAREEITNRIEKLESALFYLNMKDHWDGKDYENNYDWNIKLHELRKELEKI